MQSLREGWGEPCKICDGAPPDDGEPFAIWGQLLLTLDVLPAAIRAGRPFWHIDNGFWSPARGDRVGYYRITYRSLSPVMLARPPMVRDAPPMAPWRARGGHVVFAHPGPTFGTAAGLDMVAWRQAARIALSAATRRAVTERSKDCRRALEGDLRGAHALVTHSSNVAIDAALAGVPVVVAPTSPAAPIGSTSISEVEQPEMGDREPWLRSLSCQQFTLGEMCDGTAYRCLAAVREQVDDR